MHIEKKHNYEFPLPTEEVDVGDGTLYQYIILSYIKHCQ